MRITGERDFIVVDLDGTLCDVSERVGYAVCKDWDGFHDRIPYDPPRHDVAEFLQFVGGHCPWPPVYTVIAVTGARNGIER